MAKKLPVPIQVVVQALRDWWDDWVNMVVINLVWMLCWLTVVLGPPATFGIYYVTNQLAHGQSLGLRGMIEGSKRYFFHSWLWMLLNLAVGLLVVVNTSFYQQFASVWADLIRVFHYFLGLAWLIVQFYALPYLMEQERKHLGIALRNGLFTALAAPGYTVAVAGMAGLTVALSVIVVVPLFLGGLCLIAALGNRAVRERVETYRVREREYDEASKRPPGTE
jgi:uncharacterized membrane protein YesL